MSAPALDGNVRVSVAGLTRLPVALLVTLLAVTGAAFLAELTFGTVRVAVRDVFGILLGRETAGEVATTIIRTVRLPRALTAAATGAALGVSGLLLQTLFRNRLAGPWILGVTGGARFGVAMLVVAAYWLGYSFAARLGLSGSVAVASAASLGAAGALAIMAIAARRVGSVSLLILGLMLTFLGTGVTSVLLHLVSEEQGRIWESWNDGSFGGVTWPQLSLLLPMLALGLIGAAALVKSLDALLLGERYAQSLGLAPDRLRRLVLCVVVILAGVPTAFCGTVAFLDVAAPQIARGLVRTAEHRVLLPVTMLIGATVALLADLLTHLPGPNAVLHLNAILAVIGAPVVIWSIARGTRVSDGDL